MQDIFERLVAAGIELVPAPEITTHFIFRRDLYAALVERRADGFGAVGSAGLLTERGLAPLVLRGTQQFFVGKGFEQPASAEEAADLRRFSNDLRKALQGDP